jgi:hypothetical protein
MTATSVELTDQLATVPSASDDTSIHVEPLSVDRSSFTVATPEDSVTLNEPGLGRNALD